MSSDPAPRYRRRTRWPILTVVGILLVGGIVVWTQVLKPPPALASGCNPPIAGSDTTSTGQTTTDSSTTDSSTTTTTDDTGTDTTAEQTTSSSTVSTTLGEFTEPSSLAGVRPADPSGIPVRVLNASAVNGQAKTVTDQMRAAGFTSIQEQQNDPLYPKFGLRCYGEIRYGYAGLAQARTVLIVAPCAQLVLDGRLDNSVDLSLGKRYVADPISDEVQAQLTEIANAAAPLPVHEGRTESIRSLPPIPDLPDRSGCPA